MRVAASYYKSHKKVSGIFLKLNRLIQLKKNARLADSIQFVSICQALFEN